MLFHKIRLTTYQHSLIVFLIAVSSSFSSKAQGLIYDIGISGNASVMTSDFGFVLGSGFKIDNTLYFNDSKLTLRSSLGTTKYQNKEYGGVESKGEDILYMLDAMVEYNFFYMQKRHLTDMNKNWTPYIAGGVNTIYRKTTDYGRFPESEGFYATAKGSLGIKYSVSKHIFVKAEGYLEWSFSDDLDGYINNPSKWYQYDHTANFSIGLFYRFGYL